MSQAAKAREQDRKARARLRMLRHHEQVTLNVSQTCWVFGISRSLFYPSLPGLGTFAPSYRGRPHRLPHSTSSPPGRSTPGTRRLRNASRSDYRRSGGICRDWSRRGWPSWFRRPLNGSNSSRAPAGLKGAPVALDSPGDQRLGPAADVEMRHVQNIIIVPEPSTDDSGFSGSKPSGRPVAWGDWRAASLAQVTRSASTNGCRLRARVLASEPG